MNKRLDPIPFPDGIRLTEFLDDTLTSETHARLAMSIHLDPALQDKVDALRDTIAVLNHLPPQKAPSELYDVVRASTRRRFRPSHAGYNPPVSRFPFEAAFNVVLMTLLVVLYLNALPTVDQEVKPTVTASISQPQP
jgi:hypothetical protein